MKSFRLLRRLAALVRGAFGGVVQRMEARYPDAVYDAVIDRRNREQERLREAIGRTAYLRSRVETTLNERGKDLALVERALAEAVREPGDAAALALIQKRRELRQQIDRHEEKHRALAGQIDQAKQHLARLSEGTQELRDERAEMLARRTHAEVRRDLREVVSDTIGPDAQVDEALENARAAIFELEYVIDAVEPQRDRTGVSLEALRGEAERAADVQTLSEMRRGAPHL